MLKKIIAYCVVLFSLVLVSPSAFAYDDGTTHPALTNEIINFYNLTHPGSKLTDEERGWLVEGSRLEDTPPRWINHFYDPVHKVGWTGENEGSLPAGFVQFIARFGLLQNKPLSTVEWVKSDVQGIEYARYGGDGTWTKAVDAYLSEDKRSAYLALGHVLHLLEDMAVPDHTRNDTHAQIVGVDASSPLESYATQFDINGIKRLNIANNLKSANVKEIQQPTIEASLASLAEYSNKYFFSEDTINDAKFDTPKIIGVKNGFGYGSDEAGKEFLLAMEDSKLQNGKPLVKYLLQNSKEYWPIYSAYFLRLSKQVVLRGAGVIDLFYAGMEDARIAKEFPRSIYKVDRSVLTFPTFSIYGEIVNLGNLIGGAFGDIGNYLIGLGGKPPTQKIIDEAQQTSGIDEPIIPEGYTFSYGDEPESPTIIRPVIERNEPSTATTSTEVVATSTPTEKVATSTPIRETSRTTSTAKYSYSGGGSTGSTQVLGCMAGGIKLTEIMYDLSGSDTGREWIEIYNGGALSITMLDTKLFEGGVNHSIRPIRGAGELVPGAYAILANDNDKFIADHPEYLGQVFYSAFSLSNDGEDIAVKCGDSVLDSVVYATSTGAHGDGNSLQLRNTFWVAANPTPGRPTAQGQLPYATFTYSPAYPMVGETVNFDAASSTADSGAIALYHWYFGDGTSTSSIGTTSTHVFSNVNSFEVVLTVTDQVNATSSKSSLVDISPNVPPDTSHVVISEIETGSMRASDEFIELYNPTATAVSLSGYSIQYVSGRATSTERIRSNSAKKNFDDTASIQPHGFYSLVNSGAISTLHDGADMIYSSFALSGDTTGGAVFLVNKNAYISGTDDSAIVDSVAYGDVALSGISTSTLPVAGKSLERKANASSTAESMIWGGDRFEGNGRDTDNNESDFILRDTPESQSSRNYPESRATPAEPVGLDGFTSFIGKYMASSSSIAFRWQESIDYKGVTSSITYELYETARAVPLLLVATTSVAYVMEVPDTTHTYDFGLRACDVEGLCSATSSFSVFVRKNKAPVAGFITDTQNPRLGDVIMFDAATSTDSDGSIVSYVWDFGDGAAASSTGSASPHAFDIAGTHNIVLTVMDNEGATSSTAMLLIIAPRIDMTTSTFLLYQEDFSGGNVVNVGYQSGTQFQYLGTGLNGTVTSISIYMMQDNYGGIPTSLPIKLFESEAFDGAPRNVVADLNNPRGMDGDWVTVGLGHTLNPSKHYWLSVQSYETPQLHMIPAKSIQTTQYPYNARYIGGYIDSFAAGGNYRDITAESGSLAYRVVGTLP